MIEAPQNPQPLRERKKLRTREALISASQKLFSEKGYAATTLEETRLLMREAIEFHLEGMRLHGEHIPEAVTMGEEVEVPVPA